jgi:thioesterase domain-containing protein
MTSELRRRGYSVVSTFAIDSYLGAQPSLQTGDEQLRAMFRRQLTEGGYSTNETEAALQEEHPDSFYSRLQDVYAAHKAAADAYVTTGLEGDFTLITAADSPWSGALLRDDWSRNVHGRLFHHEVAGDHWSVLREPNVRALANAVGKGLRAATEALPA